MCTFKTCIGLVSFLLFSGNSVTAQDRDIPVWFQPGAGTSTIGLSYTAGLNFENGRWAGALRASGTQNDFVRSTQTFFELGLLTGLSVKKEYGYRDKALSYSFLAGIGFIKEISCGERCEVPWLGKPEFTTETFGAAVPIEANLIWRVSKYFGAGCQGLASLNSRESYAAFHIILQWGRLK